MPEIKKIKWTMILPLLTILMLIPNLTNAEETTSEPYLLPNCPVAGGKLGSMGEPIKYDHEGREIRFCCKACIGQFEKDPDKYLKKTDQEIIESQIPFYPLDTCVVSGEKLGSGGMKSIDKVYGNRLVRFCCAGCTSQYEANPEKYNKILDQAVVEKQKATYPLQTCPVTGMKLGSMGEPVKHIAGNRLVQFCCAGCVNAFNKDPQKYLQKIDEAKASEPAKN